MGFSTNRIFSIGKVPKEAPFRQQTALWLFSRFKAPHHYDRFLICGDWAVSAAKHNKPAVWYIHSPPRELFDLKDKVRTTLVPWGFRTIYDLWTGFNRKQFKHYTSHIDTFLCNSTNTQKRCAKYLGITPTVYYPPIDMSRYYNAQDNSYWLSVNRLSWHKRIELQLKAFAQMPEKRLIIVGCYEKSRHFRKYRAYLERIRPQNVQIRHWIDEKELLDLYAHCTGFLTTSLDEDYGLTAVEAMASGKWVIAPEEGGYKETIDHGINGTLIKDIDEDKIVQEIRTFAANSASLTVPVSAPAPPKIYKHLQDFQSL